MPRHRNPSPSYALHKQSGRSRLTWTDDVGGRREKLLPGVYGSRPVRARLAVVSETDDGKRRAESFVKDATGGDRMRARKCFRDYFEFDPTHKIVVATNHLPDLRGTDHAMWRRIRLVPFTARFWNPDADQPGPDELRQDKNLPAKLRAEATTSGRTRSPRSGTSTSRRPTSIAS